MHEVENAISVADLSVPDLLRALLGPEPPRFADLGPGNLRIVEGRYGGRSTVIVAFDYARERGSIGCPEAEQLVRATRLARDGAARLVFLMNTSGIRVTDGTAGIASLRKVLREVEDARLDGASMLAMIVGQTFGGASILAALCERRIVHAGCSYAMSGPKLIEQSVGRDQFPADDKAAVRALMGGEARAAVSEGFVLVDRTPSAYRSALMDWLRQPVTPPISRTRRGWRVAGEPPRSSDISRGPVRNVGIGRWRWRSSSRVSCSWMQPVPGGERRRRPRERDLRHPRHRPDRTRWMRRTRRTCVGPRTSRFGAPW